MSNFCQFRFMSLQETLACCFPLATQSCQFINTSERVFLVAQMVKHLPAMQETRVQSLGGENPLEKVMSTHCSILARRIPWTEEPGRLQSMMSQRVRHDWEINTFTFREDNSAGKDYLLPKGFPLLRIMCPWIHVALTASLYLPVGGFVFLFVLI